jgi:hypothetical protein
MVTCAVNGVVPELPSVTVTFETEMNGRATLSARAATEVQRMEAKTATRRLDFDMFSPRRR